MGKSKWAQGVLIINILFKNISYSQKMYYILRLMVLVVLVDSKVLL